MTIDRGALGIAIGALAFLGVLTVLGLSSAWAPYPVVALALVALLSFKASPSSRPIAVLAALVGTATLLTPVWQLALTIALALFALLARIVPSLRLPREAFARGSVPVAATLCSALVTPFALVGWLLVMKPDLSDITSAIPNASLLLLAVGGALFAVINATLEEIVWRAVFQDRLTSIGGPILGVVFQAISFGIAHAHGVPRGIVGITLAGIWAAMLGALRYRAQGLLAPILAHIVADATIAAIVLTLVRGE